MNKLFSLLIFVFVLLDSQAQSYSAPAIWQEGIVVDGYNREWQHPFKLYNSSAGLSFSIANDSTHLYLCFETIEPLYVVKMLRAGWYLQLSSKERRRRFNSTIVFEPMYIDLEPKHDYVEQKGKEGPTFENWLDDYKLEQNTYTIQGFKHYQKNALNLEDSTHNLIQIKLDYNPQKAVYEIAIPLKELLPTQHLEWKEQMKLKVNIDAIEAPPEKTKLSVGTGTFQSTGRQQGGAISRLPNTPSEPIQPKKLTEGVTKQCLYYKANFSHDFYLVPDKK